MALTAIPGGSRTRIDRVVRRWTSTSCDYRADDDQGGETVKRFVILT